MQEIKYLLCATCKKELPIKLFFPHKTNKRGYGSNCKLCDSTRIAKYGKEKRKYQSCIWMPKREDVLKFLKENKKNGSHR